MVPQVESTLVLVPIGGANLHPQDSFVWSEQNPQGAKPDLGCTNTALKKYKKRLKSGLILR